MTDAESIIAWVEGWMNEQLDRGTPLEVAVAQINDAMPLLRSFLASMQAAEAARASLDLLAPPAA